MVACSRMTFSRSLRLGTIFWPRCSLCDRLTVGSPVVKGPRHGRAACWGFPRCRRYGTIALSLCGAKPRRDFVVAKVPQLVTRIATELDRPVFGWPIWLFSAGHPSSAAVGGLRQRWAGNCDRVECPWDAAIQCDVFQDIFRLIETRQRRFGSSCRTAVS